MPRKKPPPIDEPPGASIDRVFDGLRAIIARTRRPGDGRLPTERELAEELGVQRSTVRERLAVLKTLGIIQRTQGRGTFLSMPNASFVRLYFEVALQLHYVSIEELESAYEGVEREVARLAASNARDADVEALQEALDMGLAASTIDGAVAAEFAFRRRLAEATHNPVMLLVFEGLAEVLRAVAERRHVAVRRVAGAAERLATAQREVVAAVRDRNLNWAADAVDRYARLSKREAGKVTTLFLADELDE